MEREVRRGEEEVGEEIRGPLERTDTQKCDGGAGEKVGSIMCYFT